jgi:hypothetical protein
MITKPDYDLRLLLAAKTISLLGDALLMLAVPLMIFEKTGSTKQLAFTLSTELTLYTLTTLLAGSIADNVPTRKFCLILDVVCGAFLLIGEHVLQHHFSFFFAVVFSAAMSTLSALYSASFDSIPHQIFSKEAQNRVVAQFQFLNQTALLAGTTVAGAFIGATGTSAAFFADAATFFISAALLTRLSRNPVPARFAQMNAAIRPRQLIEDTISGFRIVWENSLIKNTLLLALALNIFAGAKNALWIPYMTELHATPFEMGLASSTVAVAFLAVTYACKRLIVSERRAWARWLVLSQILCLTACLVLILMQTPQWSILLLAAVLLDMGGAIHSFVSSVARRTEIPPEYAGRSLAAARVISRVAAPAGMYAASWLIGSASFSFVFTLIGLCFGLLSLRPISNLLKV